MTALLLEPACDSPSDVIDALDEVDSNANALAVRNAELEGLLPFIRRCARRYASSADRDDLAQDAAVYFLRRWPKYRPGELGKWVCAARVVEQTRNLTRAHALRLGNRPPGGRFDGHLGPFLADLAADQKADDPAEAAALAELSRSAVAALARIDPGYAALLAERYFRGRSARDVATGLGVSEVTVGIYTKEAVQAARTSLGLNPEPDTGHGPDPMPKRTTRREARRAGQQARKEERAAREERIRELLGQGLGRWDVARLTGTSYGYVLRLAARLAARLATELEAEGAGAGVEAEAEAVAV
jgi:RNA polymerase sigma factor (sigma-70 family)